jgi:hypothetical protein
MKTQPHFSNVGLAGIVAGGVLLLATFTACNRDQSHPPAPPQAPPPPVVMAPGVEVLPDDYVYYPEYEVYYSNTRHLYYYADGGAWVWRAQPPPLVAVEILRASPSVPMDFHDSPALHHAEIVGRYPRASVGRGRAGRGEGF